MTKDKFKNIFSGLTIAYGQYQPGERGENGNQQYGFMLPCGEYTFARRRIKPDHSADTGKKVDESEPADQSTESFVFWRDRCDQQAKQIANMTEANIQITK